MYLRIILFILVPLFGFSQAFSPSTTYLRDYATNNTGTTSENQQSFTTTATSQTVTDIDGNYYDTVHIGNQIWFKQNLKTTRYRNGGSIPHVVGKTEWIALGTGAWCNYDNDVANNAIYGKLYNWFSTLGDTLCPTGWHVPSDTDMTILTDYLGGGNVAGGKMKSVGTVLWQSPNTGATNESGFSALSGGFRDFDGNFYNIRGIAVFWSATEFDGDFAWFRKLITDSGNVDRSLSFQSFGASVRCLKD